jgi:hypothetical protein
MQSPFAINHRRCRTSSRRTGRFTRVKRCVHRRWLHDALRRCSGAARGRRHRIVESITRKPAQESRESPGSDFPLFLRSCRPTPILASSGEVRQAGRLQSQDDPVLRGRRKGEKEQERYAAHGTIILPRIHRGTASRPGLRVERLMKAEDMRGGHRSESRASALVRTQGYPRISVARQRLDGQTPTCGGTESWWQTPTET